jgi:Zn-dependent peptidase ImmA (M78 family)
MIGQRLKLARSAAGLSLRDLEFRLGSLVSAQAIGKYERDEMMPGSEVLIALARALDVSEDYLLRADSVELVGVDFRKQKLTKAKDKARVEAQVLAAVERYVEIEDLLAMKSAWTTPGGFPRKVNDVDEAEAAAADVRKAWKLGIDPLPNLTEFLEEKGVKIVAVPLAERVSGVNATVKKADGKRVQAIVLNSEHPGERQRFTLAHELGHLLLVAASDEMAESACNRFAGAILIPADVLRREIGQRRTDISIRELFYLKTAFGVSAQAVAYRCADLGIINPALKSEIFKIFGKQGWRRQEPSPIAPERPTRFQRLCLRALSEEAISSSKAAELLGTTTRALLASLDKASDPADAKPPGV